MENKSVKGENLCDSRVLSFERGLEKNKQLYHWLRRDIVAWLRGTIDTLAFM